MDNLCLDMGRIEHQLYEHCPHLSNEDAAKQALRGKLYEQMFEKQPRVEIIPLNVNGILLDIKKAIAKYQESLTNLDYNDDEPKKGRQYINDALKRRSLLNDESEPSTSKLRRTGRIRKPIDFFSVNSNSTSDLSSRSSKSFRSTKPRHRFSDVVNLVQVEDCPDTEGSTSIKILIPKFFQKELETAKYQISIDLTRLNLSERIFDHNRKDRLNRNVVLNKSQNQEKHKTSLEYIDNDEDDLSQLITEVLDNNQLENEQSSSSTIENINESHSMQAIKTSVEQTSSKRKVTNSNGENENRKKCTTKLNTKNDPNQPKKKRGRKPGSKNKIKQDVKKSDIAKYVEQFSTMCETTNFNVAGSTPSVPQIITSTINFDYFQELRDVNTTQVAYFLNGELALDCPATSCQNVLATNSTFNGDGGGNGMTQEENNIHFDEIVNYLDNSYVDAGNNQISRNLEENTTFGNIFNSNLEQSILPQMYPSTVHLNESEIYDIPEIYRQKLTTHPINVIKTPDQAMSNVIATNGLVQTPTFAGEISMQQLNSTVRNPPEGIVDREQNLNANVYFDPLDKEGTLEMQQTESLIDYSSDISFKTVLDMPLLDGDQYFVGNEVDSITNVSTPCYSKTFGCDKNVIESTGESSTESEPHQLAGLFTYDDKTMDADMQHPTEAVSSVQNNCESINFRTSEIDSTKELHNERHIKDLSLLEMEENLNDSVFDYESEIDDDVLSLTTSSFNSPDRNRFSDSICFADKTGTDDQTFSLVQVKTHEILTETVKRKDAEAIGLRTFRHIEIPMTDEKSVWSEKLVCKVQNNCQKETADTLEKNYSEGDERIIAVKPTMKILKLFGSPCLQFLINHCFAPKCHLSHQFRDSNSTKISLEVLSPHSLNEAYKFIWRNSKLFNTYFQVFCEIYAKRDCREKLLNMVYDCELQPECTTFLKSIFYSLVECGLNEEDACRHILKRSRDQSPSTINILTEIILESDVTKFCEEIEQFTLVPDYKFQMSAINNMAFIAIRFNCSELCSLILKCLINLDKEQFVNTISTELVQILNKVKSGDFK